MQLKVIWLTGLSGAGKTTLAHSLAQRLTQHGILNCLLDGDILRQSISADLGYDQLSRSEHVLRVAHLANAQCKEGNVVIVALTSPLLKDRFAAKKIIGINRFIEIYLSTSLELCQQRDPKGLYAKYAQGEIINMVGLDSVYEPPIQSGLTINTEFFSVEAATDFLWQYLQKIN